MLHYATVGSNRIEEALAFYDGLMETAGMPKVFDHPSGGRIYGGPGKGMFGVLKPHNGEAATAGNGTMLAFHLDSRDAVAAFHAKALELGGTCEGEPGVRGGGAYFAYVRDRDGNKLAAYHMSAG